MKTIENLKVGDSIKIKDADVFLTDFIKENIFNKIEVNKIRIMASVSDKKKYKVYDVCKTCKMLKIKIASFYVPIKYKHISEIS